MGQQVRSGLKLPAEEHISRACVPNPECDVYRPIGYPGHFGAIQELRSQALFVGAHGQSRKRSFTDGADHGPDFGGSCGGIDKLPLQVLVRGRQVPDLSDPKIVSRRHSVCLSPFGKIGGLCLYVDGDTDMGAGRVGAIRLKGDDMPEQARLTRKVEAALGPLEAAIYKSFSN